jgi:predicted O-linked N-acetylglucosamine transferase (SPINDLY family)
MPKAAIPKTLRHAIQHHQAGRLSQAEALYRDVLARDPGCVDALHYLGVIAHQVGQPALAVEMFLQATGLAPGNPEIHFHLGDAYRRLQRLEEAVASYRQTLALRPDFPDAWNNQGITLNALGRSDEALACFRQALALQPKAANFHYNLGLALIDQGQFPEAVDCLQKTLALQPDFANAHHGTTTTCEALWMGVPVLTLAGNRHLSRVGVSLLTNVGLPEFVTTSPEAYLEAAVAAARDLPRLAALRGSLRERMRQSALMDVPRFARAVETAYRTMWHRWCSQPAPAHDQNR